MPTPSEILDQLDSCAREMTFPMMDNGFVYLVDTRLTAYSDQARWALIIEVVGYAYKAYPPAAGMEVCLYCFGNCLNRPPGTSNDDFLSFVDVDVDDPLFERETHAVLPTARHLRIRGTKIPIPRDPELLQCKGISLKHPPALQPFELMRALIPEHRELFLATEEELRQRVPPDLPQVLRLDDWIHNDLAGRELPSQVSTFQMLAEVLCSGSPQRYRPTKPSNTHWSHWPASGTL